MNGNIYIMPEVLAKVKHFLKKAHPNEVSGLGTVSVVNGHMIVTDACMIEQENTSASTDLDAQAIANAMAAMDSDDDVRWWWHYHPMDMRAWSQTDLDTIEELGQHDWFLNTVFTCKDESRTALYTAKPMKIFHDDLPLYEWKQPVEDGVIERWDKEFTDSFKVKKYEYKYNAPDYSRGSSYKNSYSNNTYSTYNDFYDDGYFTKQEYLQAKGDLGMSVIPSLDQMYDWEQVGYLNVVEPQKSEAFRAIARGDNWYDISGQ